MLNDLTKKSYINNNDLYLHDHTSTYSTSIHNLDFNSNFRVATLYS